MPVERRGQVLVQQGYHVRRGYARRDHREQAVAAVLRPGTGYALQGHARDAVKRPPDDKAIRVVALSGAESDHVGIDDGAVFAVQRRERERRYGDRARPADGREENVPGPESIKPGCRGFGEPSAR